MSIPETSIKIMESQNMSDNDDGGGRKTGREIVDGNINNMFNDISRLDRTYGRVSLREAFLSVQTDTTDMYAGAHIIISNPTKDPLVSVCMFKTTNDYDFRTAAQDRIESYVTRGPRYNGWFWGTQLAGQRQILLFQAVGTATPGVGDVLFLIENEDTADEQSQYVRITKVESTTQDFTVGNTTFTRQTVTLDIGDPLRETYGGNEISNDDSLETNINSTVVADAAEYYGVMSLRQPVSVNDVAINVDSIFTHLVPSAQAESPVVDVSLGEAGPVKESGQAYTDYVPSFTFGHNATYYFGRGIKPGSLIITAGNGDTYTDNKTGVMYNGANQRGTVNYSTGLVIFKDIDDYTGSLTAQAIIGAEISRVNDTKKIEVDINNQGYTFTTILDPLPTPKTLIVDYMSQGKWYRLRDNGKGEILPDIEKTGSGTLNLSSGSVALTCGALPDVDTSIIFYWGNPLEVEDISGTVSIDVPQIVHTLAESPVKPGSITVTWQTGAGTATATDDGSGNLSGDVVGGTVNYADGTVIFTPTAIPAAGADYTFDYAKYPFSSESTAPTDHGAGIYQVELTGGPIEPGSVAFQMTINFGIHSQIYKFTDHGNGTMSAPGFTLDTSITHPEYEGGVEVGGLSASVDYVTSIIQIDIGSLSGIDKWSRPVYGYDDF